MRTAYRVLSTAFAVGAIFPVGTLPAYAETAPVKVETAAWFWSEQTYGSDPVTGLPYPAIPPANIAQVPDGDLAVAFKGDKDADTGQAIPDKETYLAWDIYFVPEGSNVDSFTFTMYLDPAAKQVFQPTEVNQVPGQPARFGQPALLMCVPQIGFGNGQGDAFEVKPDDVCDDQVYGSFDATTQSYTFDATVYAQDWVDGMENFGVGIRPSLEAQDPFQLVFKGAADVKATISYTPAEEDTDTTIVQPDVVLPPLPPTDTTVFVPDTQPQPQPQPQVEPQPVVVASKPPVVVQPVAASPLTASRGLTSLFWFAAISGVLLLGVASLILGDPLEAAAGSRHRVPASGRHRLNIPTAAPARVTPSPRPRTV